MTELNVDNAMLRAYLDQRELDIATEVVDLHNGNTRGRVDNFKQALACLGHHYHELQLLRLVLLGEPTPAVPDWVSHVHNEAVDNPEYWAEASTDYMQNRREPDIQTALDRTSRSFTGYRAALVKPPATSPSSAI